ncbi:MAG: class I SAM-dependent methyltransferase [Synergistaceae bacterium]|nr:class I SAM-dependent methyltransferase [Synergistaceae bacterium]
MNIAASLVKFLIGATGNIGQDNPSNRDEWVKSQLQAIPSGKRLLDAGAGECKYKEYCSHLVYVSQDFNQYTGTGDGKGLQTGKWDTSRIDIVSDIVNIPEPDASFDVILCTEVFEHLFNPADAVREFARLLKTGGRLIITAPFCSLTHFAPYHFATGFNSYWYERVLKENNLIPVSITRNGNYFSYIAQELRRLDGVGKKYSGLNLGITGRLAKEIMLRKLYLMDKNDNSSGELLCFGYHVLAEKAAKI